MRGTVIQKSMGSNDVVEENGRGPRGPDSPNWRSCISTISLSRVARIEKLDARMEDQSAPPRLEGRGVGECNGRPLTKRDVRRIGKA
jgi:hypothetical protein